MSSVIQKNGYFEHPENVLQATRFDERKPMREVTLQSISIAGLSYLGTPV